MKRAVTCTRCLQTRYVKPPVPVKYVCRRCQGGSVPLKAKSKPSQALPRTVDPWYNDTERRRAIDARGTPTGWIPDRPNWLGPRIKT